MTNQTATDTPSPVDLVLMGLAGFYLYTGMDKNAAALEKLNAV